nr:HEAT repeat domain-containing protein [Acidobacteriota bacterium]
MQHNTTRSYFALIGTGVFFLTSGWLLGTWMHGVEARSLAPKAVLAQDARFDTWLRDLKAPERETRRRAVEELGRSGDERAVAPLVEVLRKDADFLVRSA